MEHLPPEALRQVAAYFQALAEPTRLQILNLLRERERNVGEIARLTGFTTPNVSRHLALLAREGLIERESRGNAAYYRIADPSIYALCDLVCGNIARQLARDAAHRAVFSPPTARAPAPAPAPAVKRRRAARA